jgi:hypothetical protein
MRPEDKYNYSPQDPLKVPGTTTLADAGTPQLGGAGSIKRADGSVHYWDGTQPNEGASSLPSDYKNYKDRSLGETPASRLSEMMKFKNNPPVAQPQSAPTTPGGVERSTFLAGTGMGLKGKPAGEFDRNRRISAMQQKYATIHGEDGLAAAMKAGTDAQASGVKNQHDLNVLRQDQAGKLDPYTASRHGLLGKLMEMEGTTADDARSMLQREFGNGPQPNPGIAGTPPGNVTPGNTPAIPIPKPNLIPPLSQADIAPNQQPGTGLNDALKPAQSNTFGGSPNIKVPLPRDIAGKSTAEKFDALTALRQQNPNMTKPELQEHAARHNIDLNDMHAHAHGIVNPNWYDRIGVPNLSASSQRRAELQKQAAKEWLDTYAPKQGGNSPTAVDGELKLSVPNRRWGNGRR